MAQPEAFWPQFEALAGRFDGQTGLAFINTDTQDTVLVQADRVFSSASVIKLFVLGTLLQNVQQNGADLQQPLAVTNPEGVTGSGVLKSLAPGATLRVDDLAVLMTIVSDNVATNRLIDYLGGVEPVNQYIRSCGLTQTRLNRKVSAQTEPLPLGVTTPREMAAYLARMHSLRVAGAPDAVRMVDIMRRQVYTNLFLRRMPENRPTLKTANKTGNIAGVRNDVGFLEENGHTCVFAAFTDGCADTGYGWDNPADLYLGELGALCLATLF